MAKSNDHISIHMPKYEVKIWSCGFLFVRIINNNNFYIQTAPIHFETPTPGASVDIADIQNYIREVKQDNFVLDFIFLYKSLLNRKQKNILKHVNLLKYHYHHRLLV